MAAATSSSRYGGEDRSYRAAVSLLSQLPSNRSITSLFDGAATPGTVVPVAPSAALEQRHGLNSRALPEMERWLARTGYKSSDLAGLRCVHVAGTKGKGSVCAFVAAILSHERYRDVVSPGRPSGVAGGSGREGPPSDSCAVGVYTSPHLVSVRERLSLNGGRTPISQDEFAALFFDVWDRLSEAERRDAELQAQKDPTSPLLEELGANFRGPDTKPFYFRFLTLLALHAFVARSVRAAVVECGIGGEHDATNILPAEAAAVSVVTALGIDHESMLGSRLPEIAWHKAGIFKRGVWAVVAEPEGKDADVALETLKHRAGERAVKGLEVVSHDKIARWKGIGNDADDSTVGEGKTKENMALAAAAARRWLLEAGWTFDGPDSKFGGEEYEFDDMPAEFVSALRSARRPRGRWERIDEDGTCNGISWWVDGAHTRESLAETGRWFASGVVSPQNSSRDRRILVFNQQDRDAVVLLSELIASIEKQPGWNGRGRAFDLAIFTRNDEQPRTAGEPERDLSVQRRVAENVERETGSLTAVEVCDSVWSAVERVRAEAEGFQGGSVQVLVTGSLYLVGSLLRLLEPEIED